MLYLLRDSTHGLTYTLDEEVYIVDTDDLVVEKTTFRTLAPYVDEGLDIANAYYSLDGTKVCISVTSINSILLTLANNTHLSCLGGELLLAYHSDEVVFSLHNQVYTIRLIDEKGTLVLNLNNCDYYRVIQVHRTSDSLSSWYIALHNFYKWGSYIVITIALRNGIDTEMCLFHLIFSNFKLVATCTTNVKKLISVLYLMKETDTQKVVSTKYKLRNLPY